MLTLVRGEVKTLNTLVTQEYDELVLTWTASLLTQVAYRKSGNTIKTLTLSYDGSNNLTGVVAT